MDSRRRSLERSALSSGSPYDEARVLLERLRAEPPCTHCAGTGYLRRCGPNKFWSDANSRMAAADEVSGCCSSCAGTGYLLRARVECAAFAGHEAAVLVVGEVPPPSPGATGPRLVPSLGSWLADLARYGVEAQVAAALGAAEAVFREWPRASFMNETGANAENLAARDMAMRVIRCGWDWLDDPADKARASRWRDAVHNGPAVGPRWLPCPPDSAVCGSVASRLRGIEDAAERVGEPAVREVAAAAVRRWALGGEA